jgi:hypothetical protein
LIEIFSLSGRNCNGILAKARTFSSLSRGFQYWRPVVRQGMTLSVLILVPKLQLWNENNKITQIIYPVKSSNYLYFTGAKSPKLPPSSYTIHTHPRKADSE